MGISLEQWIEENNKTNLRNNIQCHVENLSNLTWEEVDTLVRCIMISIRENNSTPAV